MSDDENEDSSSEEMEDTSPLPLKFRNYKPLSEALKPYIKETEPIPNIVAEVDLKIKDAVKENQTRDVLNLAPKKANWDLKRDLSTKMETLDKRTQNALAKLARENMKKLAS